MSSVVSSPYQQSSSSQIAEALRSVGELDHFYVPWRLGTGWPDGATRRLPAAIYDQVQRIRAARAYAPYAESVAVFSDIRYLRGSFGGLEPQQLMIERAAALDKAVASRLAPDRDLFFVGMPYGSLESLRSVRSGNGTGVLKQVNADMRWENQVYEEEAELVDDSAIAQEILASRWSSTVIEQVDEEMDTASHVILQSSAQAEPFTRRGISSQRLIILYNGVDIERFTPASDSLTRPTLRALFVGQVGYRKGLRYLVQAIRALDPKLYELSVYGPVVHGQDLLNSNLLSSEYGGVLSRSAIAQVYHEHDVFVMPSMAEGLVRVVLEALASGLPVIVTEQSGYGDVIRHGVEGFVVPARDPSAIAGHLEELRADTARRLQMGEAARKLAETLSWDAYRDRFLAAFDSQRAGSRS